MLVKDMVRKYFHAEPLEGEPGIFTIFCDAPGCGSMFEPDTTREELYEHLRRYHSRLPEFK